MYAASLLQQRLPLKTAPDNELHDAVSTDGGKCRARPGGQERRRLQCKLARLQESEEQDSEVPRLLFLCLDPATLCLFIPFLQVMEKLLRGTETSPKSR